MIRALETCRTRRIPIARNFIGPNSLFSGDLLQTRRELAFPFLNDLYVPSPRIYATSALMSASLRLLPKAGIFFLPAVTIVIRSVSLIFVTSAELKSCAPSALPAAEFPFPATPGQPAHFVL